MSLTNQVKFLNLEETFTRQFFNFCVTNNCRASEILIMNPLYGFSYQKQKNNISIEMNFDYYYIDGVK